MWHPGSSYMLQNIQMPDREWPVRGREAKATPRTARFRGIAEVIVAERLQNSTESPSPGEQQR